MLIVNVTRMVIVLVLGLTFGVALARANARRQAEPAVPAMLLALGVTCGAMCAGQMSLFGTPWTIRTTLSALAAAADLVFVVVLFRHGPPDDPTP